MRLGILSLICLTKGGAASVSPPFVLSRGVGHGSFPGVAGFGGVAERAIAVFKPDFGL